ncbi:MAG: hypothetical protein ACLU4J_09710 [Butyricimonas paravirosa]
MKAGVGVNVSQTLVFDRFTGSYGGNREHIIGEALRNYQEAGFSDEQNRYLYVNSYRESYCGILCTIILG